MMNNRFQARVFSCIAILSMLFSALGIPVQSVLAAPAGTALQFNGTNQHVTFGNTRSIPGTLTGTPAWNTLANSRLGSSSLLFNGTSQYVTFGAAPELGVTNFTLETWFYWQGGGTTGTTGGGGLTAVYPLITKGRNEADGSNVDANYYLGIQGGKLAADFEDAATGANHPIIGLTTITTNAWHHAAVSYDSVSAVWTLYLDGVADGTSDLGANVLPRSDSIQHAAIGSALTSAGTPAGYFQGRLDEVRVWNVVRTQAEIQSGMNSEILTPTSGLIGRWGLNDGSGTTASNLNRLGVTSFTLEAWVKRAAGGLTMSTGTNGFDGGGGRPNGIYPVLTKGMGEGENPANLNTNYFMGITADGFVGVDFEDTAGGANHPAWGTTLVPVGEWHHIAVTYTGSCWSIYLDGNLDALNAAVVACPNATPESTSYQHPGLAAGINSAGVLGAGFFAGTIDEARVWNRALPQNEIQTNRFVELASGSGLLARWGLNEGTGTIVNDSAIPTAENGTLVNGPTWVTGFPDNIPPAAPTGLTASSYSRNVNLSWTASSDSDFAGYNLYRGTIAGGPYTKVNVSLLTSLTYLDAGLTNDTTYYYVLRAVDTSANESVDSAEVDVTPSLAQGAALQFNGSNQYVTFGTGNSLASPVYTIETWFKRTGAGVGVTTGGGGITSAIPLITKGTSESEAAAADINYFLGIDASSAVLVADFEEGAGGAAPSLNHPISGTTVIVNNTWYHAAMTYDGTTLRIYLNGVLENSLTVGQPVASATTSPTAFATSIRSNGTTIQGYFAGVMDEPRIWNRALTLSEIQTNINSQLTSGSGLSARWSMDEGAGAAIASSVGTFNGTLTNNPLWVSGAPFNIVIGAPIAPAGLNATATSGSNINLTWTDNSNNETSFEIERGSDAAGPFSALTSVGTNITTHADGTVSPLTQYCYRVRAVSGGGQSAYSNVSCANTPAEGGKALKLGNASAYVVFPTSSSLNTPAYTIETWFRRDGTGIATTTGANGTFIEPMIAKGTAEVENATADINYIFGINPGGNTLCADFEEAASGTTPGLNHPICGTTAIQNGVWYHAAATYDGTTWHLYLNGMPEASLTVSQPANDMNIAPVSLGTSIQSDGATTQGFFNGTLEEVRIWNYVRTPSEILATINAQLTTAQAGLIARWGLNQDTGTAINGSAGTSVNGTINDSGYSWVTPGAPFNINFSIPAAPSGLNAAASFGNQVDLTWTDNSSNEVGFEIERGTNIAGPFSYVATAGLNATSYSDGTALPLTQYCYRVRAINAGGQSAYSSVSCATTLTESGAALKLGSANAYTKFANSASLNSSTFTLETWFRRDGAGIGTDTGTGGIASAIPLITKGTAEAENANADINYFLGIDSATNTLCADFEEAASGAVPSQNHPVCGTTPIVNGTWYHAAATYDGTTWKLYLNGLLEASLVVGQPANAVGIPPVALGTSIESNGNTTQGYFNGSLDEVRIWNYPRTLAEIQGNANAQISTAQTGLLARWSLNEDAGTSVHGSAGTTVNGSVFGSGYSWITPGAPFDLVLVAPADPTGLSATSSSSYQVDLTWTDNSNNETSFEVEIGSAVAGPFSPLTTLGQNVTTVADTNVFPAIQYCYRVRATNAVGPSGYSNVSCVTTLAENASALDFGTAHSYVTFGDANTLDMAQFTLEGWFRRDGTGASNTTGTGGIPNAIPLISNGAPEAENSNVDVNYLLCIDDALDVLCADFEEGAGGGQLGLNHPVYGTTTIQNGVWYHAAVTYDGSRWKLYLNGNLEADVLVGQPVNAANNSATALATMLTSTNTANGFFDGAMDEVRIWNTARSQAQIMSDVNNQISSPVSGLVARWGLNEGSGAVVGGTAGTTITGTVTGSGYSWITPGAPFNATFNTAPNAPTLVSPADNSTGTSTSPTLSVDVSDPDGGNLTVQFYGRPVNSAPGADFSIIAIPDTQYYTSALNGGTPAIMDTQTQWVVNNKAAYNIQFVTQLGDCTEHGDQFIVEWQRADQFFQTIENPLTTGLPYGMPYGIAPGNHDQTPIGTPSGTTLYNQFFGESRFLGRDYYGGHYGTKNDNHYELFSASGMDFIVIHLEYDTSANAAVLNWADNLLQTYSTRRAIVVTHWLINGGNNASFSSQGQAIYNALKDNPNLFLMLGGHVPSPAEGQRSDTFNGHTVYSLMSDYQGRTAGGNGWLRIITISPSSNNIQVKTYSPWLNQFEADADSQFNLTADLVNSYQLIGTDTVPSGGTASVTWPNLNNNTEYEWYAVVSDGIASTTGPTWSTTTEEPANVPPTITGQNPLSTNEDASLNITLGNLTVTDPDNTYPADFSLTVQNGANYTVAGTTITPALNFNGTLTVPVVVNDGTDNSNAFNLSVTVNPVNDAPVITGQTPLSTNEDTALTITLANLIVSDVDNTYPTGFSLTVQSGANYTFVGNTITPAANFTGTLTVPVVVNDGTANSVPFNLTVTVTPVNDAPVITGQNPLSTNEDTALTIVLANLIVADVDNTYPTGFSLTVQSGTNYTVAGTTITPSTNFIGTLTVPVLVNDGTANSNVFNLTVTVNTQNDAPQVTNPGAQTSAEGEVVSLQVIATDADIPADTLTYSAANLPNGLSINTTSGLISGTLTYRAAATSPYNVTVTVNDGTTASPANFTWTVLQAASGLCANDPALVGCWPMEEGNGTFIIDATTFGNDGSITGGPTWVTGMNGLALDLSGTGQYAMVPDNNSLDIASNRITLSAWIKPEKVATQNIIKKTTGTTTANGYELSLSAAGKVFMRLNGNVNYRIDSLASYPSDGNTWMHVAATYDGTTLRMYINGVLDNTKAATLTIAPNATNLGVGAEPTFINLYQGLLDDVRVYNRELSLAEIQVLFGNSQPTTSGIAAVNVNEDAVDTSIDLWQSFADAEDADGAMTYTLTGNTNAALFTSANINANQNLVLDYAPNVFGTSNITIRATDTGGMFVETTFMVTVASVNDAPIITGQDPLATDENTALTITLTDLNVADVDNTYPSGFTLTVLSGTDYTFAGNTITPALNFNGALTVPVKVNDGTSDSNTFNLIVTVNVVNTSPVITGQNPLATNEDAALLIAFTDLLVTDTDNTYPTDFSLTVQNGANYTVAGTTITPAANFNGTLTVPVKVNDGTADSNTFNLTVTVNPANDAPNVTNPGGQTNAEGATVSLQIVASDVENNTLTYSALNLPTGLSINPINGSINGAVDYTASASSPFNVTVTVSDGVGGVTSVNFTWTITDAIPPASGLVCADLTSKPTTASTGEKPQSKVWQHDGIWWAVFPTNVSGASSAGTWLWRLQGTTWVEELKLSTATNTKADVKTAGDVAHILLYAGTTTQLVSAEYNGASYVTWSGRAAPAGISLANSEIATIEIDSTGRMWLASENDATGQIVAYYSDSPYSAWSAPITIASGVNNDDISTIIALPSNQIGILWSNQNTQRYGFRLHNDGAAPGTWIADEVPASQSAQNVGLGMADDHMHMTVASDGTIYAVVKTSYDTAGYPKIALLVRRPAGTWDNLYNIDDAGTRATLMLDEVNGYLTVLYTSAEGYNPMVYKQSTISPIAFGNRTTLNAGAFNDASGSKGNYTSELVTIFSSATHVAGEICAPVPSIGADLSITKTDTVTSVRPTDIVSYSIVVQNNGPQAVIGASVQDTLSSAFASAAWTCTGASGGTCAAGGTGSINDLADLPVGASVTYTLNAQISNAASGSFTNTATVAVPSGMTDPLTVNNSASDTNSIIATTVACENDPTLVGCWPMEEGSGTSIIDGSAYFNDGATVNGAAWVTGHTGLALDLNGTSQYVAIPDDPTLDLTNQLTISLWIRPEQQATQDLIKKAINGGTNGYEVALATNQPSSPAPSKVFVRFNQVTSGDTYRVNSITDYPFDGTTWMHVAATYDGATIKLYINGVLESSLPASFTVAANNLPLTIGAQSNNSRYFMGGMDEVRVYNRSLTVDEIQALAGIAPLSVSKTGTGTGTITSAPAGINCGAACTYNFPRNTSVVLTAAPTLGSTFTGWSGAGCSGTGTCTVTMDAAKSVIANFDLTEYTLTITSDHGTVAKNPDKATYHYGDSVQLTATPAVGWAFTNWSGGVTGISNPVSLTINGNTSVTANYTQIEYSLTINTIGDGSVATDISGPYHHGDLVELTATPAAGWTFANWSGDAAGLVNPISITMDANKTVTALFTQNEYTLTIVSAHGTVTKLPDQPTYHLGDIVNLTATPDTGWNFIGWSGGLTDTINPVDLTITGNVAVTANYSQDEYTLTIVSSHGTVTKTPDQATYHLGDVITLDVTAAPGWTFTDWTPALTNNEVTINGNTTVTANYSQNEYTLTVSTLGNGTVSRNNNGPYHYGDVVQLTAAPDTKWVFSTWSGDMNGSANPAFITMDGNKAVTATFTFVNTAPIAANDAYVTDEDTQLNVPADGVLGNDNDLDGDALTVILVNDVQDGSLTLNADGSFIYTPSQDFHGSDSFTYKTNDGLLDSNVVTVTLTINSVNDAPDANPQSVSVAEDGSVGITLSGSDVDGDPLTFSLVTPPVDGTLSGIIPNLTYTPNPNFNGGDGFVFEVSDGEFTSQATITITVDPLNDMPDAVADTYATAENTMLDVPAAGVLGNDLDLDGDPLTVSLVTDVTQGSLTLNSDGSFTYTPDSGFSGEDTFTYQVDDGNAVDQAIVTIKVNLVNVAPSAVIDSYTADEDTQLVVPASGVLGNDTDADLDTLTAIKVSDPAHGILNFNSDGSFTYLPAANWHGIDGFTYKVSDGLVESNVADVTLTVSAVNDDPIADPQTLTMNEDMLRSITLTGADVDGDTLTYAVGISPAHGSLSGTAPSLTYTPAADYNGTDSFTFIVNDGQASAEALVNINIVAVNDAPVCQPVAINTAEDTSATSSPDCMDVDNAILSYQIVTPAQHGTAFVNGGLLNYSPAANYSGNDSFTYRASDGVLNSADVLVSVTITSVNDAPLAANDVAVTDQDVPVIINVLDNDEDIDGDALSIFDVAMPANGIAVINPDGTITYTPNAGWFGTDTFIYTISDPNEAVSSATVTVNVSQVGYTLKIIVTGSGSVTRSPNKAIYQEGEVVELTAIPATGESFINWSGDLSGSTNPISITMDSDKSVKAAFTSPVVEPPKEPIFDDVPFSYWANNEIERLYLAGITAGCDTNPLIYCPEQEVTRAQMAIFILRGVHGKSYVPPAATGTVFTDVPTNYWAADWIEQLAEEGITVGCGNGNYCPGSAITRAEMSIFLLRSKFGNTHTPPPATGTTFNDVPADYWAASWIEQLAFMEITSGCGNGNFCPEGLVTRAEMAVFLVKTFEIP
ncbi:LamG-like jellyroll fold domain-containing protein [Candidatus Villigracilis affinis]|uniref:LamG-like jellyroll fold domain-containing protein n=1 Tax=Candidatus Villigracilis affinis TaxID=3140682 RepID=UPI001DD21154|nr:tandem-95 repeat protein [Anaerolineales bacterium]